MTTAAPQTIYVTGASNEGEFQGSVGPIGPAGPPGPAGLPGQGGETGQSGFVGNYIHTQQIPAEDWLINHNLGFRPGLAGLEDDTGEEIEAEFGHIDAFTSVIGFGAPTAGVAYLTG